MEYCDEKITKYKFTLRTECAELAIRDRTDEIRPGLKFFVLTYNLSGIWRTFPIKSEPLIISPVCG